MFCGFCGFCGYFPCDSNAQTPKSVRHPRKMST